MKLRLLDFSLALLIASPFATLGCGDDAGRLPVDAASDAAGDAGSDTLSDDAADAPDSSETGADDVRADTGSDVAVDTDVGPDINTTDTQPPTIAGLRVELQGEFGQEITLDSSQAITVPWIHVVTLRMTAEDNASDLEAMRVEVRVNDTSVSVFNEEVRDADRLASFDMLPGDVATFSLIDEAGNEREWPHALTLVGSDVAILGEWRMPALNADLSLLREDRWTFAESTLTIGDEGDATQFDYEILPPPAGVAELPEVRRSRDLADPSVGATVQPIAFLDDVILVAPYLGSADTGRWFRVQRFEGFLDGEFVITSIEDQLEIADAGTWQATTSTRIADALTVTSESSGTWRVEPTVEPSTDISGVFIRTFTMRDGEPVEPTSVAELFSAHSGMLAFSPLIRVEDTD